jgi:hypothetical protein
VKIKQIEERGNEEKRKIQKESRQEKNDVK